MLCLLGRKQSYNRKNRRIKIGVIKRESKESEESYVKIHILLLSDLATIISFCRIKSRIEKNKKAYSVCLCLMLFPKELSRVVRKPVNVNPGLKVNCSIIFFVSSNV